MPGANELSTVEWQNAHVRPNVCGRPPSPPNGMTPSTALALISASVFAGSLRSIALFAIAASTCRGTMSTSSLRPTASAVAGLTPGPMPPNRAPPIA